MATDKVHFPHIFFLPATSHAEETWQPRADIYRMPDGWLVKLELAGVSSRTSARRPGPTLLCRERGATSMRSGPGLPPPGDRLLPVRAGPRIARPLRRPRS